MSRSLRTHQINIQVTAEEKTSVQVAAKLSHQTVSSYLRAALLPPPPLVVPPAINIQHWRELARVAANLNQLTRCVNTGIIPPAPELATTICTLLVAVDEVRNYLIGEVLDDSKDH